MCHIHIGVGFALLVQLRWAMRRPPSVGRATDTGSRLSILCTYDMKNAMKGSIMARYILLSCEDFLRFLSILLAACFGEC